MAATCLNCLFYEMGQCRRSAPSASARGKFSEDRGNDATWPEVESTDWCGEWRDTSDDFRAGEEPTHKTFIDDLTVALNNDVNVDVTAVGGL